MKETLATTLRSLLISALSLLLPAFTASAQYYHGQEILRESVVTARIPKKLRTYNPFWGIPVHPTRTQDPQVEQDLVMSRPDTTFLADWVTWNLDLATLGSDKYKFDRVVPKDYTFCGQTRIRLCRVLDECYKWAWRKPYGNTNVVWGPMYHPAGGDQPYAFFVAVCKKEETDSPLSLGYTSLAFIVPVSGPPVKNVYDYGTTVNVVEAHTGYNLFPKLPSKIQEKIEGISPFELFCPFQELDEGLLEYLEAEFEVEASDADFIVE